jgi:ABC-type transport system involved in multi-copper enzyme maturation permease subunit
MVILLLSLVFIMLSIWIPYNTLGEDIKMYKDSGLTLIRVVGIFAAIWAASKSVSEEIEGRTALTVLSKPVGRRQFILGKISGISLSMALLFIVLGVWFFFWVSYKPIYDAREVSGSEVEWTNCFTEATHMLPALVLAFMEVFIFVAISVAISTRLGILSNLMICFSIYVLGHLTPLIVMSNQMGGAFDTVKFFGQFVSIIFPVLNHFDVQTAINTNGDVPWIYLGWSFVYTLLYGSVSVLLALVMFEDRDLA